MGGAGSVVERLRELSRAPRVVLIGALVALAVAIVMLWLALRTPTFHLRMSAGDDLGRRHQIAETLARLAERRGVHVRLVTTTGSAASIDAVDHRRLDVALIQGGLPSEEHVREVAPLALEPLHLLVRDPAIQRIDDLRGRTVDLSPPGSGTRELALDLLALAHLRAERDFEPVSLTYDALESKPPDQLPDAVFHVTTMPSPIAEFLIHRRGYRLVELPFAEALHLRDVAIRSGVIPAHTYGAAPPSPPEDLRTPATRMLVVAHREVPSDAIQRLLDVLSSDEFARAADLPPLTHEALTPPELPLHDGAVEWLHRNDAFLTPAVIDNIESLRSFLVSLVVALFLGWRWLRTRQQRGFDAYLDRVTGLERQILALELAAQLDLPRLLRIQRQLGALKNEALEGYGHGKIGSADLLNSFLAHVTDVRAYLNALILHERERLEKKARRQGDREDDVMRELWSGAIGGLDDE